MGLGGFIYAVGLVVTITVTFTVVASLLFWILSVFVNKMGWRLYDKLCSLYGMQKVNMHFQNRKSLTFVYKKDDETN